MSDEDLKSTENHAWKVRHLKDKFAGEVWSKYVTFWADGHILCRRQIGQQPVVHDGRVDGDGGGGVALYVFQKSICPLQGFQTSKLTLLL